MEDDVDDGSVKCVVEFDVDGSNGGKKGPFDVEWKCCRANRSVLFRRADGDGDAVANIVGVKIWSNHVDPLLV